MTRPEREARLRARRFVADIRERAAVAVGESREKVLAEAVEAAKAQFPEQVARGVERALSWTGWCMGLPGED